VRRLALKRAAEEGEGEFHSLGADLVAADVAEAVFLVQRWTACAGGGEMDEADWFGVSSAAGTGAVECAGLLGAES